MSIYVDVSTDPEEEDWLIVDRNGRLSDEDIEDMVGKARLRKGQLTEDQVDAINDAIEDWAEIDPMGDDDYEAHCLEEKIAAIVEGGS